MSEEYSRYLLRSLLAGDIGYLLWRDDVDQTIAETHVHGMYEPLLLEVDHVPEVPGDDGVEPSDAGQREVTRVIAMLGANDGRIHV